MLMYQYNQHIWHCVYSEWYTNSHDSVFHTKQWSRRQQWKLRPVKEVFFHILTGLAVCTVLRGSGRVSGEKSFGGTYSGTLCCLKTRDSIVYSASITGI